MYFIFESLLLQAHILVSSQGACSQAIIKAGGQAMQENVVDPTTGDVIVTAGFNLACNHVLHTHCSKWEGGKGETVSVKQNYSGTPLFGHPLNTDTRILRTVSSRRGKVHTFQLSKINPLNTDTLACPLGVRINRVPLYVFFQCCKRQK